MLNNNRSNPQYYFSYKNFFNIENHNFIDYKKRYVKKKKKKHMTWFNKKKHRYLSSTYKIIYCTEEIFATNS